MSYIVTIRRSADQPITRDEIKGIVDGDQDLACEEIEAGLLIRMQGTGATFLLEKGEVHATTTPQNDQELKKLQEIAARLGATLQGEEGEDLSQVDNASVAPSGSGCSPVLLALVFVGALLWAYWHFVG